MVFDSISTGMTSRVTSIHDVAKSTASNALSAASGRARAAADRLPTLPGWLEMPIATDWRYVGSQSASVSGKTPKIQLGVGIGVLEAVFAHPQHGSVVTIGSGMSVSAGVGLLPVSVSISTYAMLSAKIGVVFKSPLLRRDLEPSDFTGVLNILQAGCAYGTGAYLTLYIHSKVPINVDMGLSATAITGFVGQAAVFNAECSVAQKYYLMHRR